MKNLFETVLKDKEILLLAGLTTLATGLGVYSEYFLQTSIPNYLILRDYIGKNLADFALGNMGDMMFPVALSLGTALLGLLFNNTQEYANSEKYFTTSSILLGTVFSTAFILGETLTLNSPLVSEKCSNPHGECPGDLMDIISFSVSLLAGSIYIAKNGFSSLGFKFIEKTEKQP